MEIILCSRSGKPIFQCQLREKQSCNLDTEDVNQVERCCSSAAFVSSMQGLLDFVLCTQNQQLQAIETETLEIHFMTTNELSFAVLRNRQWAKDTLFGVCVERLFDLLHGFIQLILTRKGLEILKSSPQYDLRGLLTGTENTMEQIAYSWFTCITSRVKHFGFQCVRLGSKLRSRITNALIRGLFSTAESTHLLCGLLLSNEKLVCIVQPRKDLFHLSVDDLILLVAFVYHSKCFQNSESWTPVCLPSFNPDGFLHAYVYFFDQNTSLILLSSCPLPSQFHIFQADRHRLSAQLDEMNAFEAIDNSRKAYRTWRLQKEIPQEGLLHFVYKNEQTGECVISPWSTPFESMSETCKVSHVERYVQLHQRMTYTGGLSRESQKSQLIGKSVGLGAFHAHCMVLHDQSTLVVGLHSEKSRLYATFDALCDTLDAKSACKDLCLRLKQDDMLMSATLN